MRLAYLVCLILVILGFLLNVTLSIIMLVWVKKDKVVETPKLVLYANIIHLIVFLVFIYTIFFEDGCAGGMLYLFISIPILMFNIGIMIRSIREKRHS
jgi:hypothetical protein